MAVGIQEGLSGFRLGESASNLLKVPVLKGRQVLLSSLFMILRVDVPPFLVFCLVKFDKQKLVEGMDI